MDAPDDDSQDALGATDQGEEVENLEEHLYLRERPDNLGTAARRYRNRALTKMLEQREQLVVARRRTAIGLLEQFISEEPERAVEMPDALLRLAELRWEQARVDYLEGFAAWQRVPAASRGAEPRPDYRRAMGIYDRILDRYPRFDRYDLVLYMKAYGLAEIGRADEALVLYTRILDEFPDSRFVPDAHMAHGEAAFSGSYDYERALASFERVLQYPDSGLYDVALFKSAWCLWRLNRSHDAAMRFRQVLDLGRNRDRMTATQRRRLQELQTEALEYLIQVFTEDERNSASDVFRFLQEIGGERYAIRVLRKLSETYYGQARYEQGIEAFELLLEMDPTAPEAPGYQREIAAGYAAIDDGPKSIAALKVLAETYSTDSAWARQQGDPEIVRRAVVMAERAVRQQALMLHEEGQRDRQRGQLESAAELYEIYLEHYSDEEAAYELYFYLGEIYFHRLERYSEAGEAYLAAARKNPRGRYSRDALYNAIGALERVREQEIQRCVDQRGGRRGSNTGADRGTDGAGGDGAQTGRRGDGAATAEEAATPPQGAGADITCGETDNDRKFAEAIELYVELYPNDPDLPEILFRQGRLYYDRRIYDPAVRLFGQLLSRYPTSRYAEPAGEMILDSFNRAEDYGNIERWARQLKSAPAFQSAQNQRRLDGLIVQAVFKIGEQLAARGEHRQAAAAYFRAAEEFPNDDRARQAYFNAGVERQRGGDLGGAAAAYDRLIERYPGSAEGAEGAWTAAQMYESIAQFSDAARYYESYSERFPRAEKAADALYNAVLLRVTAGDSAAGVAAGQRFVRTHPRHDSVNEVYFFIGKAQEQAEDWREAANTYREFIRRTHDLDLQVEANTRLAQVLLRADDQRGAERALEQAVRLGTHNRSRLSDGLYYAAQARYMQGDRVLAQYEAISIAGDMAGLRGRLERKSALLQRAATTYADVVEYRVAEWVTAALYQIGHSFEVFAESLRSAPAPDGLNEEEAQSYQDQLAMFIIPIEERALEAFEGGYQKAIELRIFNRWTQRLRESLTRLNDVQYPPFRELGGSIDEGHPLARPQIVDGLRRGDGAAADAAGGGSATEGRARSARRAEAGRRGGRR